MFLPVTLSVELLAFLLMTARSEPQVVLASDKAWALNGNTTTVTRSQLSRFCSPPAGHEQDIAIIASPQDNAGIKQITLHFTGATAIIYGSVLTGDPINDAITIDFEDGHASQEPVDNREGGLPTSSIDPVTGAACDVVLATINYDLGLHSVSISVVDQRIAIYNASIFATNILSTTPKSPLSTSGPLSSSSAPRGLPESSRSSTSISPSLSSTIPNSAITLGTTNQQHNGHLGASQILAIVLSCVLIPLALVSLCLWYRYRQRSRAHNSALRPYLEESSRSPVSHGNDATEKGFSNGADAPSDTSYLVSNSAGAAGTSRSKWSRRRRETSHAVQSNTSEPLDTAVMDDVATADPAQLIAIQRAVRQAGFSTQALLDSLNRVRGSPDHASHEDATSATAPPHYDG